MDREKSPISILTWRSFMHQHEIENSFLPICGRFFHSIYLQNFILKWNEKKNKNDSKSHISTIVDLRIVKKKNVFPTNSHWGPIMAHTAYHKPWIGWAISTRQYYYALCCAMPMRVCLDALLLMNKIAVSRRMRIYFNPFCLLPDFSLSNILFSKLRLFFLIYKFSASFISAHIRIGLLVCASWLFPIVIYTLIRISHRPQTNV